MGKIKLPSKPPKIDMTPMVDLFFLLLTFFMLTTSFKPQEPAKVDTPNSISDKVSPKDNMFMIYVSKENKIFFTMDNGVDTTAHVRKKLLEGMAKQFPNTKFTSQQINKFEKAASFGMPIENLPKWLDTEDAKQKELLQTGIPYDSINNQLAMWILMARNANTQATVVIKGDAEADYKTVKKVFDMVQDVKLNTFSLITTLEKVEVKLDEK